MRDQWYGDHRDLVKWSVLLLLARKVGADRIIQIAMLNESKYALIRLDKEPCAIPTEVLSHFRNIKLIRRMVRQPQIEVFHNPFDGRDRIGYFRNVKRFMDTFRGKRAVVFLDPDTGLQPRSGGDKSWKKKKLNEFARAIGVNERGVDTASAEEIARDVVFYYATKGDARLRDSN